MSLLESCCIYHENGNCNKGKHCVFFSFRKGQSCRRQEDRDRINFYRHYRQRVGDPTQPVLHEKIKVLKFPIPKKDEAKVQVRDTNLTRGVMCSSSKNERNPHALVFSERKGCEWILARFHLVVSGVAELFTKRADIHCVTQFICKPNLLEVVLSKQRKSNLSVSVPRIGNT